MGTDVGVPLGPDDFDFSDAARMTREAPGGVDLIIISGHGRSGEITAISESLMQHDQDLREFLDAVSNNNAHDLVIELRGCSVASGQNGQNFIKNLSQSTGGRVIAIDDWYAI